MASERLVARRAVVERRKPAPARAVASGAVMTTAQRLQRRVGNLGTQALVSRSTAAAPAIQTAAPAAIQPRLRVSSPSDPAELEATATGKMIARMPDTLAAAAPLAPSSSATVYRRIETSALPSVQRVAVDAGHAPAGVEAQLAQGGSTGMPLPQRVRGFMETRFRADFGAVRIHTDAHAATLSAKLNAQAFTVGRDVYFARGQFNPDTADGRELIAHELTHTIQQGAATQEPAVHRSEARVVQTTEPQVQRLGMGDALDYFADKANLIPGFRMFTIVLGVNPINMSRVERSAANILRAIIEFIPGGALITQALQNYGVFDTVGGWIDEQLRTLGLVGASIRKAIDAFIGSLSWSDILDLGGVWQRAKAIVSDPIERIIAFAKGLAVGILKFIKDAILMPLAKLAEGTRGWPLLTAVLGKNPITGEPVPRNAETLIGGFMKLIGQEDVWDNMKKANAIPRAWTWFQTTLGELMAFVAQIPTLFINTLKSLEIADLVIITGAFTKVGSVFGGFATQFITWAGNAVWTLLQIIFEVVAPGAIPYLKKAAGALKTILKNPIPFVGNLVKAGKLGFQNFADNIGQHLKTSIIEWLTGSLPGVYIPQKLELKEILKFVLSVLGLTWQNIRQKLVKVVGEPAVKAMETGFDIVVTLVTQGPAAAWDKIKEQLGNLKDMVIGGITDFIVETIVKKAVMKVVSLLIPGGAFVQAIISIYDTIVVFIDKLAKIIQVAKAFLDSIMEIASGAIGNAAKKVESSLAGLLTLAISFLAGFIGLGKVADKVMNLLNTKVRAPIDKALDFVIDWIVKTAKKLFAKVFGKKDGKADDKASTEVKAKVRVELSGKKLKNADEEKSLIASIFARYQPQGLKGINFTPSAQAPGLIDVIVSASLAEKVAQLDLGKPKELKQLAQIAGKMSVFAGRTTIYVFYDRDHKAFKTITQKRDEAGHAERFLRREFPDLMDRIRRQRPKLLTPMDAPVPIRLDINRTPCDGCANSHIQAIIQDAASKYTDIPIALSINSASVSSGAQITTEKGLMSLLEKGVELTASTVWSEIKKQMLANGIKQLEYGQKTFDIDEVNRFVAEAKDVQELIDKAVAELNKSKPTALVQGTGAS
ncbi:DUF4157 domain-containing protein [Paraburkholderia sp. SIMBA_054]|uniref:eCIS core domain-containing protein n=1 Tax=Paraburkholderia sp. SIMBA_054 TaxID=3085795 RepID=UPI00397AF30E